MSTQDYPLNGVTYKIGTIGRELPKRSISSILGDIFRDTWIDIKIPIPLLNGAWCPTYGFWAGPGWAGGREGQMGTPLKY